ncbi:MAG: patatin-like phospholipase family protein [Gammaproteobacteria bacterium]|nr:patatin-like phospholipase family protein [Gammaproteobacteria bacterium]
MRGFFRASGLLAFLSLVLGGCGSLERNPVPLNSMDDALPLRTKDIRAIAGKYSPEFQQDAIEAVLGDGGMGLEHAAFLAISGGGSRGAFGAGVLNGWTETGTRPEFRLVTGISTGALIAPFAFLGADYDARLKEVFTTSTTGDIIDIGNPFQILFNPEAFGDSTPLKRTVAKYIDGDMLRAIATRHAEGSRLYIGTTNLDSQTLSIWNMGKIAAQETEEADQLFRDIMVASSTVAPAAPPMMIEVDVDGQTYDEMHVDGGIITQVFFYGLVLDTEDLRAEAERAGVPFSADLYVLRNGQLVAEPMHIERNVTKISIRSISSMIKSSAIMDLFRIYAVTQRDGYGFHYLDVPDDYTPHDRELFDPQEMKKLYEIGYELGTSPDPWTTEPFPGRDGSSAFVKE